jgi:hypothetical protein
MRGATFSVASRIVCSLTYSPNQMIIALKARWRTLLHLFALAIISSVVGIAQVSTKVASISPSESEPNIPVALSVSLLQGETIERVYLIYRPFGESQYTTADMDIVGNVATAQLPAKVVQSPGVEFYVVLSDRNGVLETYPLSETADPFHNPPEKTLRLAVRASDDTSPDVVFLSPEPMATVPASDLVISFSLLRADTSVAAQATQVMLDGIDITPEVVFSGEMAVYVPESAGRELAPGTHRVTVRLFGREGNLYRMQGLTFVVLGEGVLQMAEAPDKKFTYNAAVQLESRHETINQNGTWYNRGGFRFTGKYESWRFLANGYATSEESINRQPQNRFYVGAESNWLRAGYGDNYPSGFPDLILSGKRVRGLHTSLLLGGFNLDMTLGRTVRPVEGALVKTFPDSLLSQEQANDRNAAYGQVSPGIWGKYEYGTYGRDLFAIRPSFGAGEKFQIGFTWMKSKDDMTSIAYGFSPQENLVVGTDLVWRFDSRRIELTGQAAFSATNSDITGGNISNERIGQLFPNPQDSSDVVKVRDILSKVITVNENLRPLRLSTLPTAAYDVAVRLNYFDNVLKLGYIFRGNGYESFGQTFLRKDIRGFNIMDRVRLFENRVYATLGFERLHDNTDSTKVATTTFTNYNAALSYVPGPGVPTVTVGFAHYVNDNGLPLNPTSGPDSIKAVIAVNDATNRFFVQSSYDFTMGARHTASLSLSTSNRDDATLRQLDVQNFSVSLGLNTRFAFPLQTGLDVSANFNNLPVGAFQGIYHRLDYTSIGMQARYEVIENVVSVLAAFTPTFGDFQRTVGTVEGNWYVMRSMTLSLEFSYFGNSGAPNDSFVSLRYRYDL